MWNFSKHTSQNQLAEVNSFLSNTLKQKKKYIKKEFKVFTLYVYRSSPKKIIWLPKPYSSIQYLFWYIFVNLTVWIEMPKINIKPKNNCYKEQINQNIYVDRMIINNYFFIILSSFLNYLGRNEIMHKIQTVHPRILLLIFPTS